MKKLFFLGLLTTNLVFAQRNTVAINVCDLIKKPLDCHEIEKNAKKLMRGKEECVLALADSICSNITRTKDVNFLIALDSIASNSDGEVSEYLMDISVKLFYHDLPLLTNYLVAEKNSPTGKMEQFMIESMSSYLSTANDRDKKRQKIVDFLDRERKEQHINEQGYKYLMQLEKRFKMFD